MIDAHRLLVSAAITCASLKCRGSKLIPRYLKCKENITRMILKRGMGNLTYIDVDVEMPHLTELHVDGIMQV